MYAIVDIETTGGSARIEKITEIAIYQHDGEKITGEFVSLVNPERNIPYFITNLTGISNEMVEMLKILDRKISLNIEDVLLLLITQDSIIHL
jgi:DNA polymerase III alpha subunit (gram-positive type)